MCTKMNDDELRDAVVEYRNKAHEFFLFAKRNLGLPFEELYFEESISTAYEFLLRGKEINCYDVIFTATKKIMNENPKLSWLKVFKSCRDVVIGVKDKKIFYWKNYAESYLKIKYPENSLRPRLNLYMARKEHDSQLTTIQIYNFTYIVLCCLI